VNNSTIVEVKPINVYVSLHWGSYTKGRLSGGLAPYPRRNKGSRITIIAQKLALVKHLQQFIKSLFSPDVTSLSHFSLFLLWFLQPSGISATSLIYKPNRRPSIPHVLRCAQDRLSQPRRGNLDNAAQPPLVYLQQKAGYRPLNWPRRVDSVQGFDGADEGFALAEDAVGVGWVGRSQGLHTPQETYP
jgi:hypothetical protein